MSCWVKLGWRTVFRDIVFFSGRCGWCNNIVRFTRSRGRCLAIYASYRVNYKTRSRNTTNLNRLSMEDLCALELD
jgi:hypothetical protein